MWPFRRRGTPGAPPPAPADGWRYASAMPGAMDATVGTFATTDFEAGLVTRRPPTFLEGLAHDITEDGPSGVITGLLEPTWSRGAAAVGRSRRAAAAHVQRFSTHPLRSAGQTMSFADPVDEVGVRELPTIDEPTEAASSPPALTVAPPVPVTAAPEVAEGPMDAAAELSPEVEAPPDARAVPEKVRPLGLGPPIAILPGVPVQRATRPAPRSPVPHGLSGPAVVHRQPVTPDERAPVPEETPPRVMGVDTRAVAEPVSVPEPTPAPDLAPTAGPAGTPAATPASRPVPTTVASATVRSAPTMLQRTETGVAAAPPAPEAGPVVTTAAAMPQSAPPTTLQRIDRAEDPPPPAPEAPSLPPTPVSTPPPAPEAPALPPAAVTPPPPGQATHRQVDTVPTLEPTVVSEAAGPNRPRVQTLPIASLARKVATTTASRRDQGQAAVPGGPARAHTLQRAGPSFSQPSGARPETAAPNRTVGTARRPVESTEAVDPSPTGAPAVVGRVDVARRPDLIALRTLFPAGPSHTATPVPAVTLQRVLATPGPAWKKMTPPVPVGWRPPTGSQAPTAPTPPTPVAAGDSDWPHAYSPAPAPAAPLQRRAIGEFAPLLGGWSRPPDQQEEEPVVDDASTEPMTVASPAPDRRRRSFFDMAAAVTTPLAAEFSSGLTTLGPDGSTDFARDAAAPLPAWTTVQPATGAPVASEAGGGGSGLAAVDTRSLTTEQLDELARRLYDKIRDRLRAELRTDRERRGRVTDLVE